MKKFIMILTFLFVHSISWAVYVLPTDRAVEWTGNAGIRGGIPNITTVYQTIDSKTYGNGVTDARSAIQTAINSCPPNQVVYLPPGTYYLSGGISMRNGVVLRGAGPANTVLITNVASDVGSGLLNASSTSRGARINITAGYAKGTSTITVADASTINSGDYIVIDQLNDSSTTTVSSVGTGGTCTWCASEDGGKRSMGYISKVTSKSGNSLTLELPLMWDFVAAASPQIMKLNTVVSNIGIENLKMSNNGAGSFDSAVNFGQSVNCWVKNVETNRFGRRHLWFSYSYRGEIRDSYIHNAKSYGQDHGYMVEIWNKSTGFLIENNIFAHADIGVNIITGGAYTVIAYNYFRDAEYTNDVYRLSPAIGFHGAHGTRVLIEGNKLYKLQFDPYWGSSSHVVVFRNHITGHDDVETNNVYPILTGAKSTYNSVVGNVLGDAGIKYARFELFNTAASNCRTFAIYHTGYWSSYDQDSCSTTGWDADSRATQLRHANFDYFNNAVLFNGSDDRTLPVSMYRTDKPTWWCEETPWPPIGSDLSPMVSDIPAIRRFNGNVCTSLKVPKYPIIDIR